MMGFNILQLIIQRLPLIIYIISRQNMRQGVLPLNSLVSALYVAVSVVILVLLKKAVKPRLHLSKASKQQLQNSTKSVLNYDKLVILSWLKKYTLIGACFMQDKKFLVKEFVFLSVYAVTCLNVNHMIIWPVGLSAAILVISFLVLQLAIFKYEQSQTGQKSTNKVKTVNTQAQSEIQIQIVNIQHLKTQIKIQGQAKVDAKKPRSFVEIVVIISLGFASIVMLLQTALTLASSLSNSGQINILSVLIILAIDQFAVRPVSGGFIWLTYKIVTNATETKPEDFQLIQYLCSQEVACLLIENQKVRLKKLNEMTASPPKRKNQSPSKVPKALGLSADAPTYLNLISFQPTKRENQVQDQQLENIYLTTAEKELFEGTISLENKSGVQTRRKGNKENNDYTRSAAQKGTTIDVSQNHDLVLIKDEPLHQIQNNHIDEFYLQEQEGTTRRKNGYRKKKNKRNLQLTGNSPYLQYLPDMLKKVDKFKNDHPKKQNDQNKRSRKIL